MVKIKIKKKMTHYDVDQVVNVASDPNGVPLDLFWRRRLRDAKIDGCCEVVNDALPTTNKSRGGDK